MSKNTSTVSARSFVTRAAAWKICVAALASSFTVSQAEEDAFFDRMKAVDAETFYDVMSDTANAFMRDFGGMYGLSSYEGDPDLSETVRSSTADMRRRFHLPASCGKTILAVAFGTVKAC